jgi:hypothetical protein
MSTLVFCFCFPFRFRILLLLFIVRVELLETIVLAVACCFSLRKKRDTLSFCLSRFDRFLFFRPFCPLFFVQGTPVELLPIDLDAIPRNLTKKVRNVV